jgi:putative transposase
MSRKGRIHIPGAVYHVILRGNNRQDIFADDKDRFRFYSILDIARQRFTFNIHAFCLMTSHFHLELQVADVPLPKIMQCIAQRYVQWFNWRHHKTGHLFERRYKAILVDTDEYLKELAAYIHLNPVRSRMVKSPEKYRWSSHRAYLGKMALPWLEIDFILSMFSPTDRKRAQASFKEFVDSMISQERNKSFHGEKNLDSRLLGDEHFVLDILDGLEEEPPTKPDLELVLVAVEAVIGQDALMFLTSAARDARSFEVRALAAWAVLQFSDATLSELARYCNRDQSTMSCAALRIEQLRHVRPDLADKMEQLRSALTRHPAPAAPQTQPTLDPSSN